MDSITDTQVIRAFARQSPQPQADRVTDFLGIRTRVSTITSIAHLAGTVEPPPIPANFHASQLEWAGALRAALQTEQRFVAIELGAGWCPWLLAGAVAAGDRVLAVNPMSTARYRERHVSTGSYTDPSCSTSPATAADSETTKPATNNSAEKQTARVRTPPRWRISASTTGEFQRAAAALRVDPVVASEVGFDGGCIALRIGRARSSSCAACCQDCDGRPANGPRPCWSSSCGCSPLDPPSGWSL